MESKKQYADRDRQAQGSYYVTHVGAMTAEGLHSKSSIAAELAHRDIEIARLHAENTALQSGYDAARLEIASLQAKLAVFDSVSAVRRDSTSQQGGAYPVDTGNPEANRIIGRLASSDPDFEDCVDAVALIHKLVAEHKGPAGFATWKDAALSERMRRVDAAIDAARAAQGGQRHEPK